ncbi:hypothetical protein CDD81_5556 [Ophiocordyceps australis]|uniref:t-SNARE coiled-coil homology domain-containing protein n=1 Tax=Ophiocordyceps australis TaxID=1399860 RepID=A0A2C5Y9Q1_9HYPO|nr:hypothetical protein CDD81_5556 [Ophiocordyceps australis]
MKKFGFGKKNDEGDDADRTALFGRKKASASPAPAADNPYAQQPASADPYANMTPYQQARTGMSQGGSRPGAGGSSGGANPGGASSGYAPDRFGSGGGYGANRYDSSPGGYGGPAGGARGPSGYGGFGRAGDNTPDENRDVLFSGAQQRQAQKSQAAGTGYGGAGSYGQSGTSGASYGDGGYGDQRELTAEEQEAADYEAILSEKRQVQKESASSVSRSVQMARQANEVGQATLARLGAQGERLHNTEKNLDLASNQNKVAQDRAAELKTLNRSMFAVHVNNPFTSKQRQQRADEEVMNRHRNERELREATRREGFAATQRMESTFRDISGSSRQQVGQTRKKDYGKFNLDDEEGADELEDQIDDGLNELEGQVSMMNMVGRAIGKEVDAQNKQIDRIMTKSDAVDDATRMNRERLARIK